MRNSDFEVFGGTTLHVGMCAGDCSLSATETVRSSRQIKMGDTLREKNDSSLYSVLVALSGERQEE